QPDPGPARRLRPAGPGRDPVHNRAACAAGPDGLLRDLHQPVRTGGDMTATATPAAPAAPAGRAASPAPGRRASRWRGPWRHAWFLEGFTWVYLLWSLAPIAV